MTGGRVPYYDPRGMGTGQVTPLRATPTPTGQRVRTLLLALHGWYPEWVSAREMNQQLSWHREDLTLVLNTLIAVRVIEQKNGPPNTNGRPLKMIRLTKWGVQFVEALYRKDLIYDESAGQAVGA